jgi:hypothetical protein
MVASSPHPQEALGSSLSLSLSLSLSALPMQLHDRVGGTVIESPYEKKNSILQIKVAIYDACDRLS